MCKWANSSQCVIFWWQLNDCIITYRWLRQLHYRNCSKCFPSFSRQCWTRFWKFCKTRWHVSTGISLTWASILCCSSRIVCGCVVYTLLFNSPQRKKSSGERSGECGAHATAVRLLMTRLPNLFWIQARLRFAVWGVAPSCWNHILCLCSPLISTSRQNCSSTWTYRSFVTLTASPFSSWNQNGPTSPRPLKATQAVHFTACSGRSNT